MTTFPAPPQQSTPNSTRIYLAIVLAILTAAVIIGAVTSIAGARAQTRAAEAQFERDWRDCQDMYHHYVQTGLTPDRLRRVAECSNSAADRLERALP